MARPPRGAGDLVALWAHGIVPAASEAGGHATQGRDEGRGSRHGIGGNAEGAQDRVDQSLEVRVSAS